MLADKRKFVIITWWHSLKNLTTKNKLHYSKRKLTKTNECIKIRSNPNTCIRSLLLVYIWRKSRWMKSLHKITKNPNTVNSRRDMAVFACARVCVRLCIFTSLSSETIPSFTSKLGYWANNHEILHIDQFGPANEHGLLCFGLQWPWEMV